MLPGQPVLVQSIDFIISIDAYIAMPWPTSSSRTCAISSRWPTRGTSAAPRERCFVSQPTLSAQLKKLEDYLGVQLIERAAQAASRSPQAGEQIVARARRILEASDEVVDAGARAPRPARGTAAAGAAADYRPLSAAARRAASFAKRCRGWNCGCTSIRPRRCWRSCSGRDRSRHPRAAGRRWRASNRASCIAEPFIVAVPDHHRLAKRDSVRVDDLKDETLLLLEDGHCLRDQALEVCSRIGLHEKQDFRATSLETLRQMVATGAGITLLPELASRGAYGNARGVAIRPFARPARCGMLGLCGASRVRGFQRLRRFARR